MNRKLTIIIILVCIYTPIFAQKDSCFFTFNNEIFDAVKRRNINPDLLSFTINGVDFKLEKNKLFIPINPYGFDSIKINNSLNDYTAFFKLKPNTNYQIFLAECMNLFSIMISENNYSTKSKSSFEIQREQKNKTIYHFKYLTPGVQQLDTLKPLEKNLSIKPIYTICGNVKHDIFLQTDQSKSIKLLSYIFLHNENIEIIFNEKDFNIQIKNSK